MDNIYSQLNKLSRKIKGAGYSPDTKFVVHDVEEEQKEHFLSHHSEKISIAFGITNTCPTTPICVVKNLQVCVDYHSSIRLISKMVAREITMKDAGSSHHLKDWDCAYGYYW